MNIVKIMRKLGWACFVLMWIPFVIAIMGWGSFDSSADGSGSVIDMLGGWLYLGFGLGAMTFALLLGSSFVNLLLNRRIIHHGEDAIAKIIKTSNTGEMTGNDPALEFTLDVRPKNHPSFIANARQTVSLADLGNFSVGNLVGVKFIPGTEKVAIAGYAGNAAEAEVIFSSRQGASIPGNIGAPKEKSAAGYYLGTLAIVMIPVAIVGFIAYMLLFSARHTAEYSCAVSQIEINKKAIEALGEPIELGFITTGNVSGGSNHRSAFFDTSLKGSKGGGDVHVKTYRVKDSDSTMTIVLTKGGKKIVIYDDIYPCK